MPDRLPTGKTQRGKGEEACKKKLKGTRLPWLAFQSPLFFRKGGHAKPRGHQLMKGNGPSKKKKAAGSRTWNKKGGSHQKGRRCLRQIETRSRRSPTSGKRWRSPAWVEQTGMLEKKNTRRGQGGMDHRAGGHLTRPEKKTKPPQD